MNFVICIWLLAAFDLYGAGSALVLTALYLVCN